MDHLDIPTLFDDGRWQTCFEAFLAHIYDMSHSEHSRYNYSGTLARFFVSSGKPPDRATKADVEQFLHQPSGSPRNKGAEVSVACVNQRLAILKSWFAWCADWTFDGPDGQPVPILPATFRFPTRGMHAGKPNRQYKALSSDELTRLFAVIPTTMADGSPDIRGSRNRAILLFYFLSGRRRAEVQRLLWQDVSEAYFPDGRGGMRKGYLYRFFGKGSSTQQDAAELPTMAVQALFHYLEVSGRLATMQPGDPLFLATVGKTYEANMPISSFTIGYFLKRYCRAAGIDEKRISLHSFRHSAAQQRAAEGADIVEIMHFLRHQQISTTFGYLQALTGSEDNRVVEIERRFSHLLSSSKK